MGTIWGVIVGIGIGFVLWKALWFLKRQEHKIEEDDIDGDRKVRMNNNIPGSVGLPFIGELGSFLAATHSTNGVYHFVNVRRQRYGKWFKTRILGKTSVFVPTVEGARSVYSRDFEQFNKAYVKSMGDLVGKKSLFIVPKSHHQKIRRALAHPFSMNYVSHFVPRFDALLSQRLQRLEEQRRSFPVLGFASKVGFDSICDVLLSIRDAELLGEIESDCRDVYDAMLSLPFMIPGTLYYRAIKARERLMKRFKSIIAERRRRPKAEARDEKGDFLEVMLGEDSLLDDEEIMDNLLTTILSGQNTTASAMMWAVKFISDHLPVQDKLREEALSLRAAQPEGAALAYEDMNKMTYTSKVIKETLRMANIVLWFPRVALANCTVDGVEIQKGWHVNVDAAHIHLDPAVHPDPLRFDPSRFDEMPRPYTYIPFGAGARTCLGINMAKVTMSIFLHRLTSGYTWTLDNADPSLECKGFIPKLKSGCPITLTALNHKEKSKAQ
ncbi:abscisic acid 8'-hydroxylase 3-like [Andrographis paniculata]|uniref:abscisic acid 8'-hydroxylase 3-like n=1 Tax=Andrographis paniculata TaxID=175694 RepID=UPI0021E9A709|nr:abscisic acid 8'-hydroxylase 3-like [Andrographis paniculata]